MRAAACGALGLALLAGGAGSARAGDDQNGDDDTFEQKVIKGFLEGMGVDVGRRSIDYHERSPLVIPPNTDLPLPENADIAVKNPAWPKDPDVKANREAKKAGPKRSVTEGYNDPARRLSPRELEAGRKRGGGNDPTVRGDADYEGSRPLTPAELGNKSSIFGSLFGLVGSKTETAPFTGEPPRTSLTEPPPGYQTPSPLQPYGVGGATEKYTPQASKVEDRPIGGQN